MKEGTKQFTELNKCSAGKETVREFIRNCHICQQHKSEQRLPKGLRFPLPIPKQIWAGLSMDFIEGLPSSERKKVVLVVVDRLSKYSAFLPLKHPYTTSQVAQLFFSNVYKLHDLPKSIVCDRDPIFISKFGQ